MTDWYRNVGIEDLNLQETGEYAANIGEDGEHERDADDAKEKAEDATANSFGRHVAVTNCGDDGEGEETSLVEIWSTHCQACKHMI